MTPQLRSISSNGLASASQVTRSLCLAELTVCLETNFEQAVAALRKSAKFADLAEQAKAINPQT